MPKLSFLYILFCLSLLFCGCSIWEIREQTKQIESIGSIKGSVEFDGKQTGPIIVLRFLDENGLPVFQSKVIATEKGEFAFSVLPGEYYIAAFIDSNRDGIHQPDEYGNYYGNPSPITIVPQQTVILEPIIITGTFPKLQTDVKPLIKTKRVWTNIGQIAELNDSRFQRANYALGFWKPGDFLDKAEGGVFFLEEYQDSKIPVLLVHGAVGGPADWESVINGIDRQHFQPWIFYYPSGLRLDMISDYLVEAVTRLQHRYGFTEMEVVAHSMGGLVTRSFIKKYIEHDSENLNRIGLVVTVNSPMAGMPDAASGLKFSPVVVSSWHDVAPESEFLGEIHSWNWPQEIPYHLVISYVQGESGDGVVPLERQAPLKLQIESAHTFVFNDDHSGTLSDSHFLDLLNGILSSRIPKK